MQNYTKIQKVISYLLIFSILFSFTVNVSFFSLLSTIFASDNKYYNIVSIFVQEEIYSGVENSVKQYAKNIQGVLEDTKTIIIPIKGDTHPFNIASLNEKLYFEGYSELAGQTGNSKLIGTVFIGDLALPVVENKGSYEKTVFPYVDFQDKLYIYNREEKRYVFSDDVVNTPKAEIWHGFISPNTGKLTEDIQEINDFFSKNNDFYKGTGNFENSKGIINGKEEDELLKEYEPYVFYYDQEREKAGIKYVEYKAYEAYLDNLEDIMYNRFTKDLAGKLYDDYSKYQGDYIGNTSDLFGKSLDLSKLITGPASYNTTPDIQTRKIIQNATKKFINVFNSSTLGEFRKDVHNAGRYNSGSTQVNVDLIPYLISSIDTLTQGVIKNVNNDLEKEIDELVAYGLSRKVPIFNYTETETDADGKIIKDFKNHFYGLIWDKVNSSTGCTIYRGNTSNSGQLVEANRGFNINNSEPDFKKCEGNNTGYWANNSPLELDTNKIGSGVWLLKNNDLHKAIEPLYDIGGAVKVNSPNPSIQDCLKTNIVDIHNPKCDKRNDNKEINIDYEEAVYSGSPPYKLIPGFMTHKSPTSEELNGQVKSLIAPNLPIDKDRFIDFVGPTGGFYEIYYPQIYRAISHTGNLTLTGAEDILKKYLLDRSTHINGVIKQVNSAVDSVWKDKVKCPNPGGISIPEMKYNEKHIVPSPWKTTDWKEIKRDMIPTTDEKKLKRVRIYTEILKPDKLYDEDLTIYGEIEKLEKQADGCGKEPDNSKRTVKAPEFAGIPHIWSLFMNPEVDLYEYLKAKPDKELEILGDKKKMKYMDSLVFALYWQSLNSVSAKYKFIFEHYLSDQFEGNKFNFYLPRNKKMYEIAYLGAPGDPKNMYIKLDPTEKKEDNDINPYADIIKANQELESLLFDVKGNLDTSSNNSNSGNGGSDRNFRGELINDEGDFKCAPPPGVPIWKWLPAVICRLKDMLPPKIDLNGGNCGKSILDGDEFDDYFDGDTNNDGYNDKKPINSNVNLDNSYSNEDKNKRNGIADYLENKIQSGSLKLESDKQKYYYNKTGILQASILDNSGNIIKEDNNSNIYFELIKLDGIQNENEDVHEHNKIINIYNKDSQDVNLNSTGARLKAEKYINFKDLKAKVSSGKVKYNFSTKSKYANATFRATLILKDQKGQEIIKQFDEIEIQIRGDLFYASTYELSKTDNEFVLESGSDGIIASKEANVYLVEEEYFLKQKSNLDNLNLLSPSKEKIFLSLLNTNKNGDVLPIDYPIEVGIFNEENNTIIESKNIEDLSNLNNYYAFEKSGIYKVEIKDKSGNIIKKEITVLPGIPKRLDVKLGTNLIEKGGVITTNVFSIYDEFGNLTAGSKYEVEAVISGEGVTFEDGSPTKKFQVFEGYKPFRLKSTNKSGNPTITFTLKIFEESSITGNESLFVVDEINFEVNGIPDNLEVGNVYNFNFEVTPTVEAKFNSRGYLVTDNFFIKPVRDYFDIKDNFGTGSFETKTKAREGVVLEFKIEGVKKPFPRTVNILPGKGMKINLSLSKSKIEASPDGTGALLYAEIKDRYDNVLWNDNSTSLELEILDKYKHIITSDSKTKTVSKGKTQFVLYGTDIPGRAFFKVSAPGLENNKVTIISKDAEGKDSTLTISGVSANAGKIETFYFWNKKKINGNKYNSLYTTLLGSSYGDITIKDNLANSIIFDKGNRALGVTTLLSDLTKHEEVININPNGNLKFNFSYIDISQSFSNKFDILDDGRLLVSTYDNTYNSLISMIYYNLKNFEFVQSCKSEYFTKCYAKGKNTVLLNSLDSNYKVELNKHEFNYGLFLEDIDGKKVFEIKKDGKIIKAKDITLELSEEQKDGLVLNLIREGEIIGNFAINFIGEQNQVQILRNFSLEEFNTITSSQGQNGGMVVYLEDKNYFYKEAYLGSSTKDNYGYIISYKDPFGTNNETINNFGNNFEFGYEEYYSKKSLGWETENKILLSFAAGKTIGEASKDYMTFALINIGDPVAKLKPIPKNLPKSDKKRKYDSTIGYQISKDDNNKDYSVFDYNADGIDDIVILKTSGEIELLEGTGIFGDFINRGIVVYLPDLSTDSPIITGKLSSDPYEDIVLLNKDNQFIFISNNQKNFKRTTTNINFGANQDDGSGKTDNTKGNISQMKGFDMDKDGKLDIVILDDMGNLYIYYGKDTPGQFEEKLVDKGLGIKLNQDDRIGGGAIFYEGLYQLSNDNIFKNTEVSQNLLQDSIDKQAALANGTQTPQEEKGFNEGLVDKVVFTQINYTPKSKKDNPSNPNDPSNLELPESIMTPEMKEGLKEQDKSTNDVAKTFDPNAQNTSTDLSNGIDGIEEGIQETNAGVNDLLTNYKDNVNSKISVDNGQTSNNLTTFLKSEYAENKGFKITKKYEDKNGGTLKGGDSVDLTITITNNGSSVNNIAYAEKIQDVFGISSYSPYELTIGGKKISTEDIIINSSPSGDYTIFLDKYKNNGKEEYISLSAGESIILKIKLKTKAFKYGYIEAGYFDETTEHGDVIFKESKENCGKSSDIYKSVAERSYVKEKREPKCENDLPENLKKNGVDADKNGVPDYIDELIASGASEDNTKTAEDYAKDALADLIKDKDEDGIPDDEDGSIDFDDSEDDFMNSLDEIDALSEELMDGIDFVLEGLSCGFGGGSCIGGPLNRAPLAPGNDPTIFGMPAGDGLHVGEGMPIFSAINFMGRKCRPTVWPPGKKGPGCIKDGAGGRLGTWSPTNYIRIFVTPTLTGAVGTAICFGAPPIVAGMSNPPGLHPFVPGGNCIVAAKPLAGCDDDGSDGEIENMGEGDIINGNCSSKTKDKNPYLGKTAKEYIKYKEDGGEPSQTLTDELKDFLGDVGKGPSSKWKLPDEPLVKFGDEDDADFGVDVDFGALAEGDFEDIVQVKMTRISPFPDYVMEWVTRQIEEIVNKLTDFPTLYVILPDFSGVFDGGWGDFINNLQNAYKYGEEKAKYKQEKIQKKIDKKLEKANEMNCEEGFSIGCLTNTLEIDKFEAQKNVANNKSIGGIKAAYEFMSNLPMIEIDPQNVHFNIPWVDGKTIDKTIHDRETTAEGRKDEWNDTQDEWDMENYTCIEDNANSPECKNSSNINSLINSIERNIEILKHYKKLPEEIYKMLKIKEIRMEQVLCNLETISKITGGRIGKNGKRFKAWVELYVLIKAILKSWQLLVDVFIDFDEECHQCKNERRDLMYFIWKLISMILPKIPVIRFPKWPDIYLDLHNIRVGLIIGIPEFEFNLRPILLPSLPNLNLPGSPEIDLNLPTIPILPDYELPELPELPSLPTVDLPDLPPPPKLPKLLSAIEAYMKILKLITKMMCILKTSPFVPEWRAGDQIAFITERTGYLDIDFLDVSLPQFTFPFVDAIKVTTFVNLEFEIDFLTEMARNTALPFNVFTNDIVHMLDIGIGDLDFRGAGPEDIDINVDDEGVEVEGGYEDGYENGLFNLHYKKGDDKISLFDVATKIALNIIKLHSNIKKESKIDFSNEEFKKEIAKQIPNIKNEKIVGTWKSAINYSFKNEDKLINDLLINNEKKFNEVKSIIQEEKTKNLDLGSKLEKKLLEKPYNNVLVNSIKIDTNSSYNTRLEKYNLKTIKSISNLYKEDKEITEIKENSKKILAEVKTGLNNFSSKLDESKKVFSKVKVNSSQLLANTTTTGDSTGTTGGDTSGKCEGSNGYKYNYKGVYIVEKNDKDKKTSYYLFDYLDEISGDEITKEADFDNDSDKDIIYMMGTEIYLKENFNSKKNPKNYYKEDPIILDENKYLDNTLFLEGVNGFKESLSDNNYINMVFKNAEKINNYRMEFVQRVDKFDDIISPFAYTPTGLKKYIIDAFSDIDNATLALEKKIHNGIIRNNIAYIDNIGSTIHGISLYTKELINIDLSKKNIINAGTKIYSGNKQINITYYSDNKDEDEGSTEFDLKDVTLPRFSNIEFNEDIILNGLTTDAYIEGEKYLTLNGPQIESYRYKPLLPGSNITYKGVEGFTNSKININYYDGTDIELNFKDTAYYEIYDLGTIEDEYLVRTKVENDFYYARIRSFRRNLFSTYTNQILLSPQKESDTKSPELNLSNIRLPIYQKKVFDVTDKIYENGSLKNIKDIYVDFDLKKDSNGDGNLINDRDYYLGQNGTNFKISVTEGVFKISFEIGIFDEIMNKTIRVYLVDENNNVGYKDVNFTVYAPIPKIENISNDKKISGRLNEPLANEPVSFYRLRNNNLTRLLDKEGKSTTNTVEGGEFGFNLGEGIKNGIEVSDSSGVLFKVNEDTGKIYIPQNYSADLKISVLPSNDKNNNLAYPKIIVSKDDKPIYYEYLVTPNSGKVEVVEHFSKAIEGEFKSKIGVYYKHILNDEYDYFEMPLQINKNSGDLFVYDKSDTEKKSLFTIFKDGRINIDSNLYNLEYDNYGEYVVYKIRRMGYEIVIGEILIIPEANYIVK